MAFIYFKDYLGLSPGFPRYSARIVKIVVVLFFPLVELSLPNTTIRLSSGVEHVVSRVHANVFERGG